MSNQNPSILIILRIFFRLKKEEFMHFLHTDEAIPIVFTSMVLLFGVLGTIVSYNINNYPHMIEHVLWGFVYTLFSLVVIILCVLAYFIIRWFVRLIQSNWRKAKRLAEEGYTK